jgi:hypothetical protein
MPGDVSSQDQRLWFRRRLPCLTCQYGNVTVAAKSTPGHNHSQEAELNRMVGCLRHLNIAFNIASNNRMISGPCIRMFIARTALPRVGILSSAIFRSLKLIASRH